MKEELVQWASVGEIDGTERVLVEVLDMLFLVLYILRSVFGNCGVRIILLDDTPCKGDHFVDYLF